MNSSPYILWITSWYPCRTNPYNGDFIQRQAAALALYKKVIVVHVEMVSGRVVPAASVTQNSGVEEHLLYMPDNGAGIWYKVSRHLQYQQIFKKYLNSLFQQKGLPQGVHAHIPVKVGSIARWLKSKYGLPFHLSEHYGIYNNIAPDNWYRRNFIFRWQTRIAVRKATSLVVVSDVLGRQMQQLVLSRSFMVIPNVVDTRIFCIKTSSSSSPSGIQLLHASTMNAPKNAEGLLRAFSAAWLQQPSLHLTMAGLAPPEIKALAISLPAAGNIHFTDHVSPAGLAGIMQESHAFVLFSHYENLPSVLLEAHCCGLPFISTPAGGIPELATVADVLIPSGDEEELARKMILVKPPDEHIARQLSEKSAARYSYRQIGKQLLKIYQLEEG